MDLLISPILLNCICFLLYLFWFCFANVHLNNHYLMYFCYLLNYLFSDSLLVGGAYMKQNAIET